MSFQDIMKKARSKSCWKLNDNMVAKSVTPPIETKDPVNVNVSIDVLKLVDIDEDDYSIEIQFEISMKWKENRAIYHNLKEQDSLNGLQWKDFHNLWLPL